jgi:hypothetical protein
MAPPASFLDQGIAALGDGDAAKARALFEQAIATAPTPQTLLLLAQSCARSGDRAGEEAAADRLLAAEPRHPAAMAIKGDRAVARGDDRAAGSWYAMVLGQARDRPELQGLARHVETALVAIKARFEHHLSATLENLSAGPRFAEALAILKGETEPQLQQPTSFYYPGLPQTAFYETDDFAWVPVLEATAPMIRAELDALMATRDGFRPYVEADPGRPNKGHALLDNPDWSAFHLFEHGVPLAENAARCPMTMALLQSLPLPRIVGRGPMALFSLLAPHTHIPPHWGMLNTRLIVHLPLIVPEGCRLRVGNHVQTVEPFKTMIFDDSIEHEAWNDSDAVRVVLLFEIWRPELDEAERSALTQMFEAIGSYGEG